MQKRLTWKEVLALMQQGWQLYFTIRGPCYLAAPPHESGTRVVHGGTFDALYRRGLIESTGRGDDFRYGVPWRLTKEGETHP